MHDDQIRKRIDRAEETKAALARVRADPGPANVAALHRLHATHLREDGDLAGAEEAETRATRALDHDRGRRTGRPRSASR